MLPRSRNTVVTLLTYMRVMLALFTDLPDPLRDLRRLGIDARLAWRADEDHPAMVLVGADAANLSRLEGWLREMEKS